MTLGEVFTALGYVVGSLAFYLAARHRRLATEGIGQVAFVGLFGGILGAKLTQWLMSGAPAAGLLPSQGGRSLLGGLVVGWICVEIAKKRMGLKRSTGDLFAFALPAGEAVGRIGCYFNGCCYGTECTLPWSVYQHGAERHPVQLYSSFVALLTLGAVFWASRFARREGDLFKLYLGLFGATRLGLEFLRARESLVFGLSPMQWFCLELVVASAIMLAISRRRQEASV